MIKVGILLDSFIVPVWQLRIIAYIKEHASFSVELVILNETKGHPANYSRIGYKLIRRIDRAIFRVQHDNFAGVNIMDSLKGVDVLQPKIHWSKFTDEFTDTDINVIREKKLDLLIRFGFRILKGNILTSTPYGIWSLHHGDNAINRGGPPAFWEVVRKEPVTGVTLQVLSDDLDGGKVLGKAFVKTELTSFNRNQNAVYWAGIELFCSKLDELSVTGAEKFIGGILSNQQSLTFYNRVLYRDPDNIKSIGILWSFLLSRLKLSVSKLLKEQQWIIYFKTGDTFERSMFRYKKIVPPKGVDWADPFIVEKDDLYYLFFEEFVKTKQRAHISYLLFNKAGTQLNQKSNIVLEEDYHLSYPFILNYRNDYYMLPEASSSGTVWLYRSESFPDRWMKFKRLLEGISLYDPTLYFHQGHWYLFGTQKPFEGNSPHQYLYLYYCDDLLDGKWTVHPKSPVTRDVRGARPAGKIFEYEGKVIRPSQIGAPKYGYGIRFQEIVKLSPHDFEEVIIEDIVPHWHERLLATHTFNYIKGFSVLDGQLMRNKFL